MALSIPRTWKKCTDEKFNQIYDEVYEEAKTLGLLKCHYKKHPLYVFESTKTWGLCKSSRISDGIYDSAICVNKKVIAAKSYDTARKIIIHEMAHVDKPGEHHSNIWRRIGNMIGKKWGIAVQRLDSYEGIELRDEDTAKYIVSCPKCNAQWKYMRAGNVVKNPGSYLCTKCRVHLVLTK